MLFLIVHSLLDLSAAYANPAPYEYINDRAACLQILKTYQCGSKVQWNDGRSEFVFKNNNVVACSDGISLPPEDRISRGTPGSSLSQNYTTGKIQLPVQKHFHSPGRIRSEDFFKNYYGANETEIRKNLTTVYFLKEGNFNGYPVKMTTLNGAAESLRRASAEIVLEMQVSASLKNYLSTYQGGARYIKKEGIYGFNYRVVSGTNRLSSHSFGTAIDIQPLSGSEYWLWDLKSDLSSGKSKVKPGSDLNQIQEKDVLKFTPRSNPQYPDALVRIMEKNGFIWGGKWYHYDVMHFEYRPEFFKNYSPPCL